MYFFYQSCIIHRFLNVIFKFCNLSNIMFFKMNLKLLPGLWYCGGGLKEELSKQKLKHEILKIKLVICSDYTLTAHINKNMCQ